MITNLFFQGDVVFLKGVKSEGSVMRGDHFYVVVEANNSPKSNIVLLAPISSIKPYTKMNVNDVPIGQLLPDRNVLSRVIVNQVKPFNKSEITSRSYKGQALRLSIEDMRRVQSALHRLLFGQTQLGGAC